MKIAIKNRVAPCTKGFLVMMTNQKFKELAKRHEFKKDQAFS